MHRSLSPPKYTTPILLGVLGNRADITKSKVQDELLPALLVEFGRTPDHCFLSADGLTSIHVEDWCERNDIPVTAIDADWRVLGRRARAIRDGRIQKEATHFLLFLSPRSDYYLTAATRLAKKGHVVYTYNASDDSLEELVVESEELKVTKPGGRGRAKPKNTTSPAPGVQAKSGHKSSTGKEQTLLQFLQSQSGQCSAKDAYPSTDPSALP